MLFGQLILYFLSLIYTNYTKFIHFLSLPNVKKLCNELFQNFNNLEQ